MSVERDPSRRAAISELNAKGYAVPAYSPETAAAYARVLGSAVNPVLREGNSDRRVAGPVKDYAKKNPHSLGDWSPDSKTHVTSMPAGDFYSSEKTADFPDGDTLRVELHATDGPVQVLKEGIAIEAGEIVDVARLSVADLDAFIEAELASAAAEGLMVSLHLKATMMKVSDPILFGRVVSIFFKAAFDKHAEALASVGANPNNGLASVGWWARR